MVVVVEVEARAVAKQVIGIALVVERAFSLRRVFASSAVNRSHEVGTKADVVVGVAVVAVCPRTESESSLDPRLQAEEEGEDRLHRGKGEDRLHGGEKSPDHKRRRGAKAEVRVAAKESGAEAAESRGAEESGAEVVRARERRTAQVGRARARVVRVRRKRRRARKKP